MAATSKDVANMAGVSIATVSRAFRNGSSISEDTLKNILEVAQKLNYKPNLVARSLKSKKSNLVGLIISDFENPFYSMVVRVIESEIKKMGYRLIILFSNEDEQQEAENLEILLGSRVDAIIFTPINANNRSVVNTIKSNGITMLQLYRIAYTDINSLVVDDEMGTYMAVKHLIKNGHKRILLIKNKSDLMFDKEKGAMRAFNETGMKFTDDNLLYIPYFANARDLIIKKINEVKPTALIPIANEISTASIKVLKELSYKIPDEMSVIVYDDIPWVSLFGLTAVSHPIGEIGLIAGRIIKSRVEKEGGDVSPVHSVVEPYITSRESVGYGRPGDGGTG